MSIHSHADLKSWNTFSVAYKAAELFILDSDSDVSVLLRRIQTYALPTLVLGEGSNVLFTKNYCGRVLINRLKGFEIIDESDFFVKIRVAAGENWHQLVLKSLALGYFGMENLSLIPGCVGAAPVQNIGAYGVEFASVLDGLEAVNLQSGEQRVFSKKDCQLSYRDSIFKKPGYENWLITAVTICLRKTPQFVLNYQGLESLQNGEKLTSTEVSQTVIRLRQSKLPDPAILGNAGSFFKNPVVSLEKAEELAEKFSDFSCFAYGENKKISAAWLLEKCGWKGYRQGDAGVYENHALVLVNHGKASGQEIWQLACQMRDSVDLNFGICLEPEIKIIT